MATAQFSAPGMDDQIELQNIARQRQYADALRKQSMEALPQGQMVGNHYVAPSFTQGLAKLLQAHQSGQLESQADEQQRALANSMRERNAGDFRNISEALRGTPGQEVMAPTNDTANSQNVTLPAKGPDMGLAMDLMMQSNNPTMNQMGQTLFTSQFMPKEAKWEKTSIHQPDGSITHGYVNINSKTPESTFRPLEGKEMPKLSLHDLGGSVQGFNPYTMQAMGGVAKSNTPDALLTNARTVSEGALNRGVTMRGQNLVDARSRETLGQNVYDPERGMLVNKMTGEAKPVMSGEGAPIGAKDKALTDSQAKAALFGSRMKNADEIMAKLAGSGTQVSVPGSTAGMGIGATINALQPESNQQLDQAKRDFVNAVLRRESGAAISPSEFDSANKQYFPQVGESKATREQKANARAIAIRGMLTELPEAQREKLPAQIIGKPSTSIDSLLDKYK
ncbi:MAG: hypothetical protein KGI54_08690 [Pseudomonadota bacterium]|nr:hypothetical protein [Pseudomonadota bacterium]